MSGWDIAPRYIENLKPDFLFRRKIICRSFVDPAEAKDDLVDCFKPEMMRAFPDIDFAFLGYNIMRGYPLTSGRDPGFTHRVNLNSDRKK